jgi:hypothetical protein
MIPRCLVVMAAALAGGSCFSPSTSSPSAIVQGPAGKSIISGPFRVEFRKFEVDPGADAQFGARVLVTIHKDDPEAGPVRWVATHYETQALGRASGSGYRHWVHSEKLQQATEVDFNTGMTLRKVTPRLVAVGLHGDKLQTCLMDEVVVWKSDGQFERLCQYRSPEEDDKPTRKLGASGEVKLYLEFFQFHPHQAMIRIARETPDAGFVEWTRVHEEGARIGWSEYGGTVHSVYSRMKDRDVNVDFDAGAVLSRVTPEIIIPYDYRTCARPVSAGSKCTGPRLLKDFYRTREVAVTFDGGVTEAFSFPVEPRRKRDTLCESHGGSDRSLPSQEVLTQAIERVVQDLLRIADSGWTSKNPRTRARSRSIYEQVLRDYSDARGVVDNFARLSERSRASIEE